MNVANKYIFGFIVLVVLVSSVFFLLPEKIRIDIQETRTQYKLYDNGSYKLVATEYTYLYDGTKKMLANYREIKWINDSGIIDITRLANYKDNISTFETYTFDSAISDIELVPVSHEVICVNCVGKILHFEYRDLTYEGITQDIVSPFIFGKMKLTWQSGSYFSKVYQQVLSDKLIIKYKPKTNYEIFNIRLFDPPTVGTVLLDGLNQSRTYEYETTVNISANVSSGATYIDILDDTNRYINQSNWFNYTINLLRINKFSDGNTVKSISSGSEGDIDIDNRTELYSAKFNISGTNSQNLEIATSSYISSSNSTVRLNDSDLIGVWEFEEASGNFLDTKTNGKTALPLFNLDTFYQNDPIPLNSTYSTYGHKTTNGLFGLDPAMSIVSTLNPNAFTLGCWVNNSIPADNDAIMATMYNTPAWHGWELMIVQDPGTMVYIQTRNDGAGEGTTQRTATWTPGYAPTLMFIVGMSNASGMYLLVNSTVKASAGASFGLGTIGGGENFTIAGSESSAGGYGRTLTGGVDSCFLINRSLSEAEIVDVMNNGFGSDNLSISESPLIFPGNLIGNNLYQNQFIYSGVSQTKLNLSYITAESKTVYLNFSNQGNFTRKGYFNFTLKAFDLDVGNSLDYWENFTSSAFINLTSILNTSAHMSVYDDFENNATASRFTTTSTTCSNLNAFVAGQLHMGANSGGGSAECHRLFNELVMDNVSIFNFTSVRDYGSSCVGDCSWSWTQGMYMTDNTNTVTLYEDVNSGVSGGSGSATQTFEGRRVGTTWTIYRNGVQISSGNIVSLNSPYYLKLKVASSSGTLDFSSVSWVINSFNTSGIRLKGLNGTYETNVRYGSFESSTLFNAPNNIIRILLSFSSYIPENTSIQYFVSNNNGSTYESVVPDSFHTLTSTGKSAKVKFILNSTTNINSPFIPTYRLRIVPASPSNLGVDVGSDGFIDMNYSGTLNSSNTPINYTGNDSGINDYINDSCSGGSYCVIPIDVILGSGGLLELSNVNLTENINPISLNISPIQDLNTITLSPTYTGGAVSFSDLKFDFRGSKNITVYAHNSDYTSSINRTIFVKYSPFNLSFIDNIEFFEVIYTSRNQSEAEPYGQNSTDGIFKITSLAYDGNISVYARYNESPHSCLTKQEFKGQNFSISSNNSIQTLNITNLTASLQPIVADLNSSNFGNIRAYSMVNCSAYNFSFIPFTYFCFNSLASDAVITPDFADDCQVVV